jgi:hypothetical protein
MGTRIPSEAPESAGFFQSLYDGIFKGDFSDNDSATKTAAQIGVGFIPIAGQIADARDTIASAKEIGEGKQGAWGNLGFSLVGWIPVAGDFLKSARKIGVRNTVDAIGGAFRSIGSTWRVVSEYSEEKMGEVGALFYKPAINMKAKGLPSGTYGVTNRWGDIDVSRRLDAETAQSTLDHEKVHQFLSPKLNYGQDVRSTAALVGYAESHLLRRVEEGLAEAWARWKAEGISGIAKGWRFPLENPYDIDPDRLRVERNILLGAMSSATGVGLALGEAATSDDQ